MAEPWFRRWMGVGYVPINWQGWSVLVAMLMTFGLGAAMFFTLADSNPVGSWACAGLAAVSAFVGHATVVWKLDHGNGS